MDQTQSESIDKLVSAVVKAQAEMGKAKKDSDNPYFKSKYADLNSVIDASQETLGSNGLCIMQAGVKSDDPNICHVKTILAHTSGQWISSVLSLPVKNPNPNEFGSSLTYGRRYGQQAIFNGSSSEDDDGATAMKPYRQVQKKVESLQRPTPSQIKNKVTEAIGQTHSGGQSLWNQKQITSVLYAEGDYEKLYDPDLSPTIIELSRQVIGKKNGMTLEEFIHGWNEYNADQRQIVDWLESFVPGVVS